MSTEAEARARLFVKARYVDPGAPAYEGYMPHRSFAEYVDAYRDAILAAEREGTAVLVEAARRVYEWGTADSIYEPEMSLDDKSEDMNGDGYFDALGAALRAYEERVSE